MKQRITAAELKAMTVKELAAWVEFNACAINRTMVMSWGHEELFKGYHIRPEYIGYNAGRLIVKTFHFTSRTRKADAQSFAEWLHWAIFGEYPAEETAEQVEETEETETEPASPSAPSAPSANEETTAHTETTETKEGHEHSDILEEVITMTKVERIINWFEEHEDVFNDCIEELDSYNGYLGDDRYYSMDEYFIEALNENRDHIWAVEQNDELCEMLEGLDDDDENDDDE